MSWELPSQILAVSYTDCMAATGLGRKVAVFLPSVLIILLVILEGTHRFAIGSTADLVSPWWFRHFGHLPYQRGHARVGHRDPELGAVVAERVVAVDGRTGQ